MMMTIATVNPVDNTQLRTFDPLTAEQLASRIEQAHDAFSHWRETSFEERKRYLLDFARRLRDEAETLSELITTEMGKKISESRKEIAFSADICEYYANGAEDFLADHTLDIDGAHAYIQYAPIGVLLGVMPWNFPFYQVVRYAAPNIMAGNTVLVRHATNVPQCAQRMQDLLDACDLPCGVFTNLFIPTEFVDTVIADARVQGVSLTGSEKAGAAVGASAGKHIKRSVLELGGNDAFIVLEDADLDHTIEMAVKGRMVNTGQSCVASKRFIVVKSLAEDFTSRLKVRMSKMRIGDPMDEDTDVGPLSTERAAVDLYESVQASINAGAKAVLGGDRPERKGAFFNPTILTGVSSDMPTYDKELFGPVATIYVVENEADAIELANDSSYGLGGSVYTRDVARGERVARRIDTGMMFVNQPTNSQVDLPFGGTKNSGYGRELSALGIREFVNKKLIHMARSK